MQHNSLVYFPEIEINSNNILNISSTQVSVQKYQNAGTHTHTHTQEWHNDFTKTVVSESSK